MRWIILFGWMGFAALAGGLIGVAVVLDSPNRPETQCRAKWAEAAFATWSYGTECMVYLNGVWVPEVEITYRPNPK